MIIYVQKETRSAKSVLFVRCLFRRHALVDAVDVVKKFVAP